jgi:hypothetical protein
MAARDGNAKVLTKLAAYVAEGKFYEAEQLYQTLYARYVVTLHFFLSPIICHVTP